MKIFIIFRTSHFAVSLPYDKNCIARMESQAHDIRSITNQANHSHNWRWFNWPIISLVVKTHLAPYYRDLYKRAIVDDGVHCLLESPVNLGIFGASKL